MKFTWQKVIVFVGIIGLGLIGLMVADQYDFIGGRKNSEITIGDGTADPLVTNTDLNQKETAAVTIPKQQKNPAVDGIKKSCEKGKC
jgi:hypothetical protein